jgi:predicted methyltransferase
MRRFLAIGLAIGLLAPGLHAAEGEAARHDSRAARVWTLPLTYRLGALDHDKYAKVGEADNFLLKFRKVGGRS